MKHLLSNSIIHRLRTWAWVTVLGIVGVSCGLEDGTITGTDFEREYLRQLPPQRSTLAPDIDSAYYLTFWVSVVFFVAIVAAMGYFVWKYRRSVHPKPEPTGHNDALEIFWTVTPVILFVIIFVIGWDGYMKGVRAPENALDIRVEAAQWKWEIEHENGVVENNTLTLPVNQPVRLIMTSQDVLHAFYVPEFRVKRDIVPGMFSSVWFEATHEGEYHLRCAEYCGAPEDLEGEESPETVGPFGDGNTGHSAMRAVVNIVSAEEYEAFLAAGPPMPAECASLATEAEQMVCWGGLQWNSGGCTACHNGQAAPDMGRVGRLLREGGEEQLMGGRTVTVTEEYIVESILQPQAKIVPGYSAVMPAYRFSENQLNALIAYIRSMEESP